MFLEVYEEHNKEFEALVGKGLSYRTLQKYKTIKAYVAEFLMYQYAVNDIELNRIDYQFIKNCNWQLAMHTFQQIRMHTI